MFDDHNIDYMYFGNDEWPGNSQDLNRTENLGAIVMDRFDAKRLEKSRAQNKYSHANAKRILEKVLTKVSNDTELFQ